jgi:hypothetical protein
MNNNPSRREVLIGGAAVAASAALPAVCPEVLQTGAGEDTIRTFSTTTSTGLLVD